MAGALIITAQISPSDLAWLDRLRRANYPADRNRLPAHLTMFHSLPPSSEQEARSTLSRTASVRPPRAMIDGLINLGRGVAYRIVSDELKKIRDDLAESFHGLLTAQDAGGWLPHVTIQNKVAPKDARTLLGELEREFTPRSVALTGLDLYRYLDGPWEKLASYRFRGS